MTWAYWLGIAFLGLLCAAAAVAIGVLCWFEWVGGDDDDEH